MADKLTLLPKTIRLDTPFSLDLILIPAGEFLMGSDKTIDEEASDDELPQHKVQLPDYYIAKYPVTEAQWTVFTKAVMSEERWAVYAKERVFEKGEGTRPQKFMNWYDATEFCDWMNDQDLIGLRKLSGFVVRLPTEVEWEKAGRGTDGRIYPWGNEFDMNKCNTRGKTVFDTMNKSNPHDTTPVGKYSPQGDSPYGIADMCGNVCELTNSKMEIYPYTNDEHREHKGYPFVVRGGTWDEPASYARCAYRRTYTDFYDHGNGSCGFRVVVGLPDAKYKSDKTAPRHYSRWMKKYPSLGKDERGNSLCPECSLPFKSDFDAYTHIEKWHSK